MLLKWVLCLYQESNQALMLCHVPGFHQPLGSQRCVSGDASPARLRLHRSMLHFLWASAGRAWPGILRTFWIFFQSWLTSKSEKLVFLCVRTALWGSGILTFSFLFSLLLTVFVPLNVALGIGYLFIWWEYVNLCSPLSLTLCTLAPFFFCWNFEWRKCWVSL